jgi:hypothetical protein
MNAWIGVDFDGTLAHYHNFKGAGVLGAPIPLMVDRVRRWLAEGKDVRIFTARVWQLDITSGVSEHEYNSRCAEARAARIAIKQWCYDQFGKELPITCEKDYGMVELWDDRAKQVYKNIGVSVEEEVARLHKEKDELLDKFAAYVGPVSCPCGLVMEFQPRPTVADPAHMVLFLCKCGIGLSDFPPKGIQVGITREADTRLEAMRATATT